MQLAASKALTELTHRYPKEYRALYHVAVATYEMQESCEPHQLRRKAQASAKAALRDLYPVVYKALYENAVKGGYPRSTRSIGY